MSSPPQKPPSGKARSRDRPKTRRERDGSGLARSTRRSGAPGGARDWALAAGEGRILESIGWWIATSALIFPPLVMLGGLRDPFRLPKTLLTELLVPLSLVFLAFGLRRIERVEARRLLELPALRALAPLWLVTVLSAWASAHTEHALEAVWSMSIGTLAIVAWSVALPRKRRTLDLLLVPAVALAGLAVLQRHEVFRPFDFVQGGRAEMSSLAGNVADLGAYLVLPLVIAQAGLVRALAARRISLLVGAAAVSILLLYALLVGQTLSATAAAFAATAVFWWQRAPARLRIPLLGGALAVGVFALLLVAPARERVFLKLRQLQGGALNEVLTGRLDGWRAGVDMLAHNPVLGVGPGAYRAEFATTKLHLIDEGAVFWQGHSDGSSFGNAHNELIEIGADLGVLGLLALGWCGWVLLRELRRRPANASSVPPADGSSAADRRALQWAGLTALAVLSSTYFPLRTALVAYPFVLLFAWMLEPRDVAREDEGAALPVEFGA